jgi:hypothetical protein
MKTHRPKSKLKQLEDSEDIEALRKAAADILTFGKGKGTKL